MTNIRARGSVRFLADDFGARFSHYANMSKRKRSARTLERLEEMKQASGWYAAAWRDFKNLTLEELADELGTGKSVVSELESGAPKRDGKPPARYNRDWADKFAKALGTTPGHIIDVNPFTANDEFFREWAGDLASLDDAGRDAVVSLLKALKRTG